MPDLSWREAIVRVLQASAEAMHYADIADAILEQGLKHDVGATPAQTVNATIAVSIKSDGEKSPFVRTERGRYSLRSYSKESVPTGAGEAEGVNETGLINAYGMYWARSSVLWTGKPQLLGRQAKGSAVVDFCGQQGVYLLHDRRDVVYVGRTTDQPLGVRIAQHVQDRLNGRWERFSWFGVRAVNPEGALVRDATAAYDLSTLIITMEALLIEGLEPPQNRKRGDGFKAVEFLQVEDPEIKKQKLVEMFDAFKSKL